jgi:dihydroorotate dehydrogenase
MHTLSHMHTDLLVLNVSCPNIQDTSDTPNTAKHVSTKDVVETADHAVKGVCVCVCMYVYVCVCVCVYVCVVREYVFGTHLSVGGCQCDTFLNVCV